jgi:hypothetical protein
MSQVVAMAKRLQEAEKTIAELRERSAVAPSTESVISDDCLPMAAPPQALPPSVKVLGEQPEARATDVESGTVRDIRDNHSSYGHLNTNISQLEPAATELSIDENGKICYYGQTSAVHDPPALGSPLSLASSGGTVSTKVEIRSYLNLYAKEAAMWEDLALGNVAIRFGIPREIIAKLLHLHWTWVAPMFMWVYRPAFMRE